MGFRQRIITKSEGKKTYLESMRNEETGEMDYWIIPQKFSVDAMQQITQSPAAQLDLTNEEIEGKSAEEIEKIVVAKLSDKRDKKSFFDQDTIKMMQIGFLNGIKDHNFDDEEGNKLILDEALFNSLKNYPDTLLEIFRIVMRFNYPLAGKK